MIRPGGHWTVTFARDGRVRVRWQRRAYSRWYDLGDVCRWFHSPEYGRTVVFGGWLFEGRQGLNGTQRELRRLLRERLEAAQAAGGSVFEPPPFGAPGFSSPPLPAGPSAGGSC